MFVVVAASSREQLCPPPERLLVGDRVRADVCEPVVQSPLTAERLRNDEQPRVRVAEGDEAGLDRDHVEREKRLGCVEAVLEPEARLHEGTLLLREDRMAGIHLLPALAAWRRRELEWAREVLMRAARFRWHRHGSASSSWRRIADRGGQPGRTEADLPVWVQGDPAAPAASCANVSDITALV